jgi:hypothetical protein
LAIQIKGDGSFSIEYEGPYQGLDVEKPETLISDKASPSFNNFMLRNAEIRSRPALVQPFGGFGSFQLGVTSFLDINGAYHTVGWSGFDLFQYDPTLLPGNPWRDMGQAAPGNMQTNPVSYRAFANTVYYTDVGFIASPPHLPGGPSKPPTITPFMGYWDGILTAPVFTTTFADASVAQSAAGISRTNSPTVGGSLPGGPTMVGPLAIGAGFIGELNNQLILANVSVKDQGTGTIFKFPNLIWWSANGLPLQWDPTVNTSAGENPFLDVPDLITGLATMGIAGYIFRTNGITQFAPTGSAVTPFAFDHMWASEHGIGNVQPWSIAQYGPSAAFIADDNIYTLSVTNATPIGGTARDAIYADIANAVAQPFANITPKFKAGYVYLTYMLLIPMSGFVRMYVYSFEDKNWSAWDLPIVGSPAQYSLTCAPNLV